MAVKVVKPSPGTLSGDYPLEKPIDKNRLVMFRRKRKSRLGPSKRAHFMGDRAICAMEEENFRAVGNFQRRGSH